MKQKTIKLLCVFMAAAVVFAAVPKFTLDVSAAQKGSASCSAVGQDGVAKATMVLNGASYTSGSTATYIVDRYYYSDMSAFGNIYSVTFEGTGMVANTSISASGDFSISNSGTRSDQPLNTSQNVNASATDSGTLVGSIPEPDQSATVTLTANCRINYKISGQANGLPIFSSSTSVSMTAVVIGIDTTDLHQLVSSCSGLRQACWTSATWTPFASALSTAQSLLDSPTARQSDIDSAYTALSSAKNNLVHDGLISACEYCRSGGGNENITVDSYLNQSYGSAGERNLYDLYLPANTSGDISMILYIHGGAWIFGSKEDMTSEALSACRTYGVATAAVSYRYASLDVHGWDILNDIQTAVAHIKQSAADKGLNIKKMMVCGFSAGAHLSLMYAYTKKDVSAIDPVCVFSRSGPAYLYNEEYMEESSQMPYVLSCICGQYFTEETRQYAFNALLDMSPAAHVTSTSVPTVVCHGMKDNIVPYKDSVILNQALDNAGVTHEYIVFPNSNHGLESDPDKSVLMQNAFERYVDTYLLDVQPTTVHHYVATVTPATCTTEGYTRYTCTDCGKYYLSDFVYPTHSNGEEVRENVVEATCTTSGSFEGVVYCTVCGQEVSRTPVIVNAKGHTAVTDQGYAATCTSAGLTDGSHCSVCNAVITAQTVIPATGHTVVVDEASAPTCTSTGLTQGSHCSVCNAVLTAQTVIPATGHTVVVDEAYAPTCTAVGKTQGSHCSVCGTVLTAQEDIAALGHTPLASVRENETASTCIVNGGYDDVVYCSVCGGEISREHTSFDLASHKAGAWETTVPATYTSTGTQVKRCTVCSATIATKTIPVLTPEYSVKDNTAMLIDGENMLLKNVPQGTDDLSDYLTLAGCTVETEDTTVGTGTVVTIKNFSGITIAELTAVVGGDLTGDGYVDAFDIAVEGEYINTFTAPEDDFYMCAADIFEDGYLDAIDLAYVIHTANFEG